MIISPYYIIIALGCFAGAVLMFTRFRQQSAIQKHRGMESERTDFQPLRGSRNGDFSAVPADSALIEAQSFGIETTRHGCK